MRARSDVLRFLLAGILNTAVGYISFLLIYSLLDGLFIVASIATSVVISLLISLAFSYQMQKRFVWRKESSNNQSRFSRDSSTLSRSDRRRYARHRQKTIYATYYLSLAALNIASVRLLKDIFSVDPRFGQAVFTLASSLISFFFLRWLFRKV